MAPLIEDLARRLDTSPEQARRLLQQLLAELRSQAEREGHTTLRGLGTFSRDDDTWAFEPTETLARSINRSFDDLEPVGVSMRSTPAASASEDESLPESAPFPEDDPAADEAETAAAQEATERTEHDLPPSEATPPTAEHVPEEDAPQPGGSIFDRQEDETGEERPSRGLFTPEPPEGEDVSEAAPTPESEDRAAEEAPPSQEPDQKEEIAGTAERTEREEDAWALPGSFRSEAPRPSWNYAALPAGYLVHRHTPLEASDLHRGRLVDPAQASFTPPEPPSQVETPPSPRAEDRPAEEAPTEKSRPAATAPARGEQPKSSGSGLAWVGGLLVLVLLGGGLWYVLNQQEETPDPSASAPQAQEAPAAAPGPTAGETPAAGDRSTDTTQAAPPPSPAEQAFADTPRIDRAQGGWTVVVASETTREAAERTAQRFAQRFQAQDYPIDILQATVEGTQRYRVVVGQFDTPDQVIRRIEQDNSRFPQDAWGLEIEPGA